MRRVLALAVLLAFALPGLGQIRGPRPGTFRAPGPARGAPRPTWARPMGPGSFAPRSLVPAPAWRRPDFHNFIRPLPFFDRRHNFLRRPGFRGPVWFSYYAYPYSYYPYGYYPYYDPFFYYSYDSSAYQSSYDADMQLSNQIENLRLQLQQLREQDEQLRQQLSQPAVPPPSYAAPASPPAAPAGQSEALPPATVLVFRDGHRREVRNFAIVGQTLWILSEAGAQKVPLSSLDLDQTVKANEERGIAFPLPQPGGIQH